MNTLRSIVLNVLPVIIMILLIPVVLNDYWLTVVYIGIILVSLLMKRQKNDLLLFGLGFIFMFFSEWLFISTGVETFVRDSLFGLMPLWLPFLWGYGFIVIKRVTEILK